MPSPTWVTCHMNRCYLRVAGPTGQPACPAHTFSETLQDPLDSCTLCTSSGDTWQQPSSCQVLSTIGRTSCATAVVRINASFSIGAKCCGFSCTAHVATLQTKLTFPHMSSTTQLLTASWHRRRQMVALSIDIQQGKTKEKKKTMVPAGLEPATLALLAPRY